MEVHILKLSVDGATETNLGTITWEAANRNGTLPAGLTETTFSPGETLMLRTDDTTWDRLIRHWGVTLRTYRYPPTP